MAWDIHGNRLERGHCEVHPWIHQEYPCGLCCRERDDHERQRAEQDRYYREQEDAYYASMWAAEAAPWFDPDHPMNR